MVVKHVLRYLHGMIGYGLRYISGDEVILHGYEDSDWARSAVERKSTFECCFSLGLSMISLMRWK